MPFISTVMSYLRPQIAEEAADPNHISPSKASLGSDLIATVPASPSPSKEDQDDKKENVEKSAQCKRTRNEDEKTVNSAPAKRRKILTDNIPDEAAVPEKVIEDNACVTSTVPEETADTVEMMETQKENVSETQKEIGNMDSATPDTVEAAEVQMDAVDKTDKSENASKEKGNDVDSVDGTASECGSTDSDEQLAAAHVKEGILTEDMLKQEKLLHKESAKEEEKLMEEAKTEWENEMEHQRLSRLNHLLEKSNMYSEFLMMKMEEQKAAEEKKKIKLAKKLEKEKQKQEAAANQEVPEQQRRSSRQGGSLPSPEQPKDAVKSKNKGSKSKKTEQYRIADYLDKDKLAKKQDKKDTSRQVTRHQDEDQRVPKSPELQPSSQAKEEKSSEKASNELEDTYSRTINGMPVSDRQPLLLTGGVLRKYQLDGISWLKVLYENGVNGILADEMGLGKTVQCIGLVSHLVEKGVTGPFLIAAPLSTLPNWISEFQRFAPKIPIILYHGTIAERTALRKNITKLKGDKYKCFPTIITSYEIIMKDRVHLQYHQWKYVIVDEGHRIKNLNCKLIQELKSYRSSNRLLLTGTPLQNNLAELWSLLNFLLPDIFDDLNSFQAWFDFSAVSEEGGDEKIIAQEQKNHILERLHAILTPFLLRRLKTDVEIAIPPKKEILVYAPLTPAQEQYYKSTLDRSIFDTLDKNKKEEKVKLNKQGRPVRRNRTKVNYKEMEEKDLDFDKLLSEMSQEQDRIESNKKAKSNSTRNSEVSMCVLNILMQLRKCCNHPYLIEYPLDPQTNDYRIDEDLVNSCGKFLILDQLLPALKEKGHKVLIFSQMTKMLDILGDYLFYRKLGYSRLDGSMSFQDRKEQIEFFNTDPDVFVFLLSTRAGGLGLNLASADTVIIYDSDWNPQMDLQAQDRCHRIGQTKPVIVYRFVTANSVDQKIVETAASKRKLEKMVIHKGKFKGQHVNHGISPHELLDLLQSSDHNVITKDNHVLSDEDLKHLLDRSNMKLDNSRQVPDTSAKFKVIDVS